MCKIVRSIHRLIKLKTIQYAYAASSLSMHHSLKDKNKDLFFQDNVSECRNISTCRVYIKINVFILCFCRGWYKLKTTKCMCYFSTVDCCFIELAIWNSDSTCWSSTKQIPQSHQNIPCSHQDMAGNYSIGDLWQLPTRPLFFERRSYAGVSVILLLMNGKFTVGKWFRPVHICSLNDTRFIKTQEQVGQYGFDY